MKLRLVKRPNQPTIITDDDTGEQVEGVTNVQYTDNVGGALLSITVADFAIDVLSDAEILRTVEGK